MKKLFVFFTLVSCLTSCHKSLSDQAAQEALDFTRKYCPTPVKDFERTDSMTFDRDTKTFVYWKTLFGKTDNKELIKKNKTKLHDAILLSVRNNPSVQLYRKDGFTFRYVFHSGQNAQNVLLDMSFGPKDYNK